MPDQAPGRAFQRVAVFGEPADGGEFGVARQECRNEAGRCETASVRRRRWWRLRGRGLARRGEIRASCGAPRFLCTLRLGGACSPSRRSDRARARAQTLEAVGRPSGGAGDFFAGFAFGVALQPLVGVADRFGARPAPDGGGEEAAVFEQPADAREFGVAREDRADEARAGGCRRRGAEAVGCGDLDLEGVGDVERSGFVRGAVGARDRRAFAGQRGAADPLVGVLERRGARPFAGGRGEGLAVDRQARDVRERRRSRAGRGRPSWWTWRWRSRCRRC